MNDTEIWVEKYRPAHVKHVVMPKSYHDFFGKMLESKECQNLLLYSSTPGSGKTSVAKAIANDLEADCMYINSSAERGIDVLRTDIAEFASTQSMFSTGQKIVILDECDGATAPLQQALRAAIESYEKNCRFILTCNYVEKIIPALREGRLNMFDFNFGKKEFVAELKPKMAERVKGILTKENVEFEPEAVETLVDANYPSLRKMISLVSKISRMYGKVTLENLSTPETARKELYTLIESHSFTAARDFVVKNSLDIGELYSQLYKEWLGEKPVLVQARIIPYLADFQYQHNFVIDQELNFASCMLSVMAELTKIEKENGEKR